MQLLSDPAFGEEFDTIVDEITDEYLKHELPDDERERVEKHFLRTAERQNKLAFATELLRRAESERGRKVAEKKVRLSLFEQIAAFFKRPSFAYATITAVLVIAFGLIYFQMKPDNSRYLALNLAISPADRAEGPTAEPVKLPPNTGLKLTLTIPESARGAKDYVARLAGGSDLKIAERTEQAVTVTIPAGTLTPGTYAVQLSRIKSDNTTERIPGSYYFTVE